MLLSFRENSFIVMSLELPKFLNSTSKFILYLYSLRIHYGLVRYCAVTFGYIILSNSVNHSFHT